MSKFQEITVICGKEHVFVPGVCIACERDRFRTTLERVLHYWQERYHRDFSQADEVLIDEIRRVERSLMEEHRHYHESR